MRTMSRMESRDSIGSWSGSQWIRHAIIKDARGGHKACGQFGQGLS